MSRTPAVVVQSLEEEDESVATTPEAVVHVEPVTVSPTTKTARVKGTWTQYYGGFSWHFEDGKTYTLPLDLYEYLKSNSCIYDTL